MSQVCEQSSKRDMQTDDESEQVLAKKQKLDESIDTVATEGVADDMPNVTPSDVAIEPAEPSEEAPEHIPVESKKEHVAVAADVSSGNDAAADVAAVPVEVAVAAVSAEVVESSVTPAENPVEVFATAESNE